MTEKGNGIKKLFKESFFVYWLTRFACFIYKSLGESVIGHFMSSYNSATVASKGGILSNLCSKSLLTSASKKIKQTMMKGCEQSFFLGLIKKISDSLLYCSLKFYGIFLFSTGMYTSIVYVITHYALNGSDTGPVYLMLGVIFICCAVPLMFCNTTLAAALCQSRIMSAVLFGFLGIRREKFEKDIRSDGKTNMAFIFGIICGVLSYAISPVYIMLGIAGIIGAVMILESPETGVVIIFAALPFLSTMQLVGITAYVLVCFFLKLIRGKRTVKLHSIDIFVFLFMLYVALGGIFSVNRAASIKSALVFVCFILGYFLTVNLIKTGEWVKRCAVSIALSSAAVSIYGIYENFFGKASSVWLDEEMFENISGRVVSTFSNPNVLAEYLLMAIPFIFTLFITSKKTIAKTAYLFMFAASCACLVYTWSRGAWLGFAFAVVVYLLIWSKKSLAVMSFGIFALPLVPFVLPQNILARLTSIGNLGDTSTAYRVNIWKGVLKMAKDYWKSGIGIGEGAFSVLYPQYSLSGIERAPHSHNLYLQILLELGAAGLILFIILVVIFAQSSFSFYRYDCEDSSYGTVKAKLISAAGFCGICAVLLQGMTDYVWYNYRVFYMFWLVMGLVIATRRSRLFEKPEHAELGISTEVLLVKKKKKKVSEKRL